MKKIAKMAAAVTLPGGSRAGACDHNRHRSCGARPSYPTGGRMGEAYQQMQAQISQLRQARAAMSGDRGMAGLLGNQNRSYLPPNWNEAMTALNQGGTSYGQLAAASSSRRRSPSSHSRKRPVDAANAAIPGADTEPGGVAASHGASAYNTAAQRVQTLQALTNALNGPVIRKRLSTCRPGSRRSKPRCKTMASSCRRSPS